MRHSSDVAIIGGGVIGCSIAYYLAKQGIRSTVFEQRRFGSGASGATAGVIGPLQHIPPTSRATLALGLRSLEMFPTLVSELSEAGVDPEYRQNGILSVALTPEQADELKRNLTWQGETGLGPRWLSSREVLDREPLINPEVLGAVFSPREGHVRGQRLVDALVHAASKLGASFVEGAEVTGLETEGRRVTGVRVAGAAHPAGHTVLAAGPWSGIAGRWVPDRIPVRPVKGQRILLRSRGLLPTCPVRSSAGYTLPQADGNILVGATRHEGEFDQEITADAVAQSIADAALAFPVLRKARFVEARAGVRPGSPDGVPLIGPLPEWDGLSVASGHDAVGIMLSPGTAELVADYIRTGDEGPLRPFSPSRFAANAGAEAQE